MIQMPASWASAMSCDLARGVVADDVERVDRARRDEAGDLAAFAERVEDRVQGSVGDDVAVVGQEHVLAREVVAHPEQALADEGPGAGVGERDPPVADVGREVLHLASPGEHEVVGHRLVVVEEVVLDHVRPVAETEHEVAVAVVGVVAHHVPQDRPVPDPGHGLGQDVGRAGEPEPLAAAEQDDLHGAILGGSGRPDLGELGEWHDEARPAGELGQLGDDLQREVPGQDQQLVGRRLEQHPRVADRDAGAGQVAALLGRRPVDSERELAVGDPGRVEERDAAGRGAVRGDRTAFCGRGGEMVAERGAALGHGGGEPAEERRVVETGGPLGVEHLPHRGVGAAGRGRRPDADPQGAAIHRVGHGVRRGQPVAAEQRREGAQGEVAEVAVPDRVELDLADRGQRMVELDDGPAAGGQEAPDGRYAGVEVRKVGEPVDVDQEVGGPGLPIGGDVVARRCRRRSPQGPPRGRGSRPRAAPPPARPPTRTPWPRSPAGAAPGRCGRRGWRGPRRACPARGARPPRARR